MIPRLLSIAKMFLSSARTRSQTDLITGGLLVDVANRLKSSFAIGMLKWLLVFLLWFQIKRAFVWRCP